MPAHSLTEALSKASVVWLAISDSAIMPFYETYLSSTKSKVVHFSGALNDARLLSVHPLMSFPQELFADTVYENIHFTLTGVTDLKAAMPGFKNPFSILRPEHKALYHALCVVAGNFPQLLWNETLPQFQKLEIPDHAFGNYIKQITENFIQLKQASLTGPFVRKDMSTIEKNKMALVDTNLKNIYQSFAQTFTTEASK